MKDDGRFGIQLEPELGKRLNAYCKENNITKSALIERLCRALLNNADTSEAEKNLYLIWIDKSLKAIIKKIADQNAEIDCLRKEVREAVDALNAQTAKRSETMTG